MSERVRVPSRLGCGEEKKKKEKGQKASASCEAAAGGAFLLDASA
jgi:hypothetical protein